MSATHVNHENQYAQLDAWIDAHFDEQVRFLQELVRVPTDTPPGNNAPHAERTAELLAAMGIGRSRFYAAFIDKRSLFIECLDLFSTRTLEMLQRARAFYQLEKLWGVDVPLAASTRGG